MSGNGTAKKTGRGFLRWAVTLGLLAALAIGAWTAVRHSILDAGKATGSTPLVATVVLGTLTLILLWVSARRTQDDLVDYRRAHEGAGAVATAALKPGALTGFAVRGLAKGSADLVDILAPALATVFGAATVGWAVEVAGWPPIAPVGIAAVLAAGCGTALAARVGAFSGRRIRPRDVEVQALPAGIVGAAVLGGGAFYLAETYGRVEPPTIFFALLTGLVAGVLGSSASFAAKAERRRAAIRGQVAAALGVPDSALAEDAPTRWKVNRRGEVTLRPGGGAGVAKAAATLDELDARLAAVAPELMVDRERSGPGVGLVLAPVTPAVRAQRALLAETDGQVVAIEQLDGGSERWSLAATVSPAHAERVDALARRRGMTLTSWAPFDREATVGKLSEAELLVRQRAAELTRQAPWELTVTVTGVPERDVDVVTLTGAAWPTGDARQRTMRELISRLPGGNPGWVIDDQPAEGVVTMAWRKKPELPRLVPANRLLPETLDPTKWANIPLGVGADGSEVSLDLKAGPHSLVVGGTGSGKTVAVRLMIACALARGFEVIMIDPRKRAAGLLDFEPYLKGVFKASRAEAAAALDAVYAEVERRVDLIDAARGENWLDLPPGTVKPWLVIVDEFSGLVSASTKPPGDKNSEEVKRWEVQEAAKGKIVDRVGSVAKEARSAGVHLVVATQRPDAKNLPGEVRDQLGTIVQLIPPTKPPSKEALGMVFPTDLAPDAVEQIAMLGDGKSPGFAIGYADGGTVRGFRIGFLDKDEIVPAMEALRVPPGVPLDVELSAGAAVEDPIEGQVIEVVAPTEEVVELDEVDLDDVDLDLDDGPAEPPVSVEAEVETPGSAADQADPVTDEEDELARSWGI